MGGRGGGAFLPPISLFSRPLSPPPPLPLAAAEREEGWGREGGAVGGPSSYSYSYSSFGGRYKKALGRRKEGVPRGGGGGTNKEGRKGLGGDSTDVKRLCTLLVYQLVMSARGLYICCSSLRFNEHQKSSSRGREMSLNVCPFPSRPRVQQQSEPAAAV